MLWKYLKGDQRGRKLRRQCGIGDYIIDFFCTEKKLAIEIDGSQHFEESATHYDAERSRFLESRGCAQCCVFRMIRSIRMRRES